MLIQVHYTLCGGTIAKLGTEKHHRKYFAGLDNLTLPGCFGMTELGCAPVLSRSQLIRLKRSQNTALGP